MSLEICIAEFKYEYIFVSFKFFVALGTSQREGQQFLSSERFTQDPLEENFARRREAVATITLHYTSLVNRN